MRMVDNARISSKLVVLALLPSTAMLIMGLAAAILLGKVNAGVDRIYVDRLVPMQDLKTIADDYAVSVIDAVNKANAGRVTAEDALRDVRRAQVRIQERWSAYLKTQLTPREAELVAEARQLLSRADQAITAVSQHLEGLRGQVAGQLRDFDGPLYEQIDPISSKVAELVSLQLEVARDEREAAHRIHQASLKSFATLALVSVLGVALFGWVFYRSIIGQLGRLRLAMTRIVDRADLSTDSGLAVRNEIGDMARSFDAMVARLRGLVEQISGSAMTLSSATRQMADNLGEVRGLAERQRQETDQVATAIEEMTASAEEVARNTATAATAAADSKTLADQGQGAVSATIVAMSGLASGVTAMGESIRALEQDTRDIGKVLDVIQAITSQTNLLALNAAIEAARAGEVGRGFAVVADEVRTLAQRTQSSAQEIEEMVQRLQQNTRRVATEVARSQEVASVSVDTAGRAGQMLASITSAVDGISATMAQIASAAEEQTAVAAEISRGALSISEAGRRSSRSMGDLEQAGQALEALALELRDQATQFKLGDPAAAVR
jgi:methyl-accepting chemotaxis protein